jgi:hypothetical protein
MRIGRIDAPRQAVLRFVITVVGNSELDSVKGLLEGLHHFEDDVLVIVLLDPGEIQIGRKPSLAADEHFSQAGPALEGKSVQYAALGQKLKQKGQHDFLFRDHDVAKTGIDGVALHLRLREHS